MHPHPQPWNPDHLPHAKSKPEGVRKNLYAKKRFVRPQALRSVSQDRLKETVTRLEEDVVAILSLRGFGLRPGAAFTAEKIEGVVPHGSTERAFTSTRSITGDA